MKKKKNYGAAMDNVVLKSMLQETEKKSIFILKMSLFKGTTLVLPGFPDGSEW